MTTGQPPDPGPPDPGAGQPAQLDPVRPDDGQPVVAWTVPGGGPGTVQSARALSRFVLGGLALNILIDLASIAHYASGPALLDRFLAGTADTVDLNAWDGLSATLGLAYLAVFILTAVVWLTWQYRLVASVGPLTHDDPLTTPGKSIVWWFVPFANLVMVYRIYRDLVTRFAVGSAMVVGAWWGIYLVANLVSQAASQAWQSMNSVASFDNGVNLWMASDALTILSAVLAMRLVVRLQRGQDLAMVRPPATGWLATAPPPEAASPESSEPPASSETPSPPPTVER